jgi:hypothetical protein
MNISDNELALASLEFDEFIHEFALKYKLPALMVSSIVMARLIHLNKNYGNIDHFNKLLDHIIDTITLLDAKTFGNLH